MSKKYSQTLRFLQRFSELRDCFKEEAFDKWMVRKNSRLPHGISPLGYYKKYGARLAADFFEQILFGGPQ